MKIPKFSYHTSCPCAAAKAGSEEKPRYFQGKRVRIICLRLCMSALSSTEHDCTIYLLAIFWVVVLFSTADSYHKTPPSKFPLLHQGSVLLLLLFICLMDVLTDEVRGICGGLMYADNAVFIGELM